MSLTRQVALLALALGVCGCAVRPMTPAPPLGAGAELLTDWEFSGRLALSDGRDGGSGRLDWQQRGDRAELRFHGAFGRGGWRLTATREEATLEFADGGRYRAARVEALVRDHVGWEVPVEALRYWVRGLAEPGARATPRYDRSGRLTEIRQHQWNVQYEGSVVVDEISLPRKVTATRDRHRVRLVIRRWGIDRPG